MNQIWKKIFFFSLFLDILIIWFVCFFIYSKTEVFSPKLLIINFIVFYSQMNLFPGLIEEKKILFLKSLFRHMRPHFMSEQNQAPMVPSDRNNVPRISKLCWIFLIFHLIRRKLPEICILIVWLCRFSFVFDLFLNFQNLFNR